MNAPTTAPLHALIASFAQALEVIDEAEGEVSPEIGALLDDLAPKLADKIDALAGVRARYLADAASCAKLAEQYASKAARHKAGAERVTAYVTRCLQEAQLERVKGTAHTAYLGKNTRVIVTVPARKLPARFQRVVPEEIEPDKKALKAALDAGETIDGVTLEVEVKAQFR